MPPHATTTRHRPADPRGTAARYTHSPLRRHRVFPNNAHANDNYGYVMIRPRPRPCACARAVAVVCRRKEAAPPARSAYRFMSAGDGKLKVVEMVYRRQGRA